MEKALTQINEQRLSGTRTPDYTTANIKRISDYKVLEQIAQRWADHGYYPSPGSAMEVLLEGCHE